MKRPRDSRRQKLYNWEIATFCDALRIPHEPEMLWGDVHAFVRHVVIQLGERVPHLKQGVRASRGYGGAEALTLPRSARRRWYILHEITHCLMLRTHGTKYAWHGAEFARVYLELLNTFGGYTVQATAMKKHGVKVETKAWFEEHMLKLAKLLPRF